MSSPSSSLSLSSLKREADRLRRDLRSEDTTLYNAAIQRLQALEQFADLSEADRSLLSIKVQRKHLLQVVAKEAGFPSWVALKRHLDAQSSEASDEAGAEPDWTTFFGSGPSAAFLNHWFTNHEEAKSFRESNGGYLFPYKSHCLVAEEGMVEALGVEPKDPDWERIGFDWVEPQCPHAWHRLKTKLVEGWKLRQSWFY